MSIIKKGSSGQEVTDLQGQLHRLGYDPGKIDGDFGPKTHRAVVAFQKEQGLDPDGIVGPKTTTALRTALKDFLEEGSIPGDPSAPPSIDRTLRLDSDQYYHAKHKKDLIVLHHTAGGSAASTVSWWNSNKSHIATAYIIERDGTIHEVFDPEYWAYHLGVKGTNGSIDRRSIGIEIACEGGLKRHNGSLYKFDRVLRSNEFKGASYIHPSNWRGYDCYAAYTPEQMESVTVLTNYLLDRFSIPRKTPANHYDYDKKNLIFKGVIGHHHVRGDKSDVHPGFGWAELVPNCKLHLG